MDSKLRFAIKNARWKYGKTKSPKEVERAKETTDKYLFCRLSILEDSYRNEAWVRELRELIQIRSDP